METRYYFSNGHYWKLDIDYDEYCEDVRDAYDHFCTMTAWCGWYDRDHLGDDVKYNDLDTTFRWLVRDNVSEKQLVNFIRNGHTAMSIVYNRHTREWELYGDNASYLVNTTDQSVDWLIDDMIDELSYSECAKVLEKYANMILVPLNAAYYGSGQYDFKESRYFDFDDCNGIAWTDKKTVTDCMLTSKDWKKNGYRIIEQEVNEYRLWVQGYCYYAQWSQYDFANRDWIEADCVGSFLSDAYGDDLFREISEVDKNKAMYEDFESLYKGVA